jgi:hypothetical protein
MRSRLFTILAVTLLAASVPATATAAEEPWTRVTPAPVSPADFTAPATLSDVAAVSPSDVWAVGGGWTDTEQPVITHWTGKGWDPVKSPEVPNLQYSFASVDAVSASDVWAVGNGEASPSSGFSPVPVIAHYDGHAWSMVPPPTPPASTSDVLIGIDMVSATDGWAVGTRQGPLTEPSQPLLLRWRGGRWSSVVLPRLDGARLTGISVRAGNDVWAVGSQGDSALIMHMDGTRWTAFTIPPGGVDAFKELRSVTSVAAGEAWAVGASCVLQGDDAVCVPLIMRLSGGVWQEVHSAGDGGTHLQDVIARSSDDVWVVGYDLVPGGKENDHTEHWDGKGFTTVPVVDATIAIRGQLASALEAVTRLPGTNELWAVGWEETGPHVIRHS